MTQKLISQIRVLFGLFLLFFAVPAIAGSDAWTVSQKSGHVEVLRAGMQPASLKLNASLNAGDTVVTGRDGRAMLTRGNDYLLVNSNSRLAIPAEKSTDGFTRLKQWIGSVFYDVETTGKPHFEVETPLLAAVVKGTQFTITVEADRASVHVTEGVVQVSTADRLASRDVEAGHIATIYLERSGEIDLAPASDILIERDRRDGSDLEQDHGQTSRNDKDVLAPISAALPLELVEDGNEDVFHLASAGAIESETAALDTLAKSGVKETVESIAGETTEVVKAVSEDVVVESVDEVVAVVEDTADVVTQVVDSSVEEVVSVVDDTVDSAVGETVEEVTAIVDDTVVEAVDETVEEVASVVDDTIDETVDDTVEEVTAIVDDTIEEAVDETVEEVASVVDDTIDDTVSETVEEVASIVDETVEEAVSETVEEVASLVDETVEDSVVETVEEAVVETVEETVEEVVEETVEEVVEETVEEAAEEAVEEVEEVVDDVLDGLSL